MNLHTYWLKNIVYVESIMTAFSQNEKQLINTWKQERIMKDSI